MQALQYNKHFDVDMDDSDRPIARGIWSEAEHERFLEAMKMYPLGPWRTIADHIGTRSIKQVQTHAQKYQQKVARRQRGLRKQKKRVARPEHRVDQAASGFIIRKAIPSDRFAEPPSSPSSFEELLMQAATPKPAPPAEHFHLAAVLDTIEPLPFSLDAGVQPLHFDNSSQQHDLVESLQLFLACV